MATSAVTWERIAPAAGIVRDFVRQSLIWLGAAVGCWVVYDLIQPRPGSSFLADTLFFAGAILMLFAILQFPSWIKLRNWMEVSEGNTQLVIGRTFRKPRLLNAEEIARLQISHGDNAERRFPLFNMYGSWWTCHLTGTRRGQRMSVEILLREPADLTATRRLRAFAEQNGIDLSDDAFD